MKNKFFYHCSGYLNGPICENGLGVRRDVLEDRLLGGIKTELLSDKSVAEFTSKMRSG